MVNITMAEIYVIFGADVSRGEMVRLPRLIAKEVNRQYHLQRKWMECWIALGMVLSCFKAWKRSVRVGSEIKRVF